MIRHCAFALAALAAQGHKAYVRFREVKGGEKLTITYPVVSLVQKQTVKISGPVRDITVTWLGNTAVNLVLAPR